MMRFAFVLVLVGLVWTFWGFPRLRTLAFPFLLLATMVPLPVMVYNSLAAPLQLLASDLATRIAQVLGRFRISRWQYHSIGRVLLWALRRLAAD